MVSLQAIVGATWCLAQYGLLRGRIILDTPDKQRALHCLNLLMAYAAAIDPHVLGPVDLGP